MNNLSNKDHLDFMYLLELMKPLSELDEYSWLPELFSIIGPSSFLLLCKVAGGEIIKIPKLDEVQNNIYALQYFYDVYISKKKSSTDIPERFIPLITKIKELYARQDT